MRDCNQCGKLVDGLVCGYCGYSEVKAPEVRLAAAHKPANIQRRNWTKAEWDANGLACQPWIARCKQILREAETRHRNDSMPHILSSTALAGISYDPEAVAEREAIQSEIDRT